MSKAIGKTKEYALDKYQMLRFEANVQTVITLLSGKAEMFGTELVCGTELLLECGQKGTIVTFHGCKISAKDSDLSAYVLSASEDQELPHVYVNIHANLNICRQKAMEDESRGPRVLICGQESVGKATLCRSLVNYAARRGAKPILVDVNVGLNQVFCVCLFYKF